MVAALEPVAARQMVKSQEDGTLVLPAEVRDVLEIRADEDVLLFKTEQGILVTTREKLSTGHSTASALLSVTRVRRSKH